MSTEGLSHHISSRYNADLERLRSSVLEMGGLVERQLTAAQLRCRDHGLKSAKSSGERPMIMDLVGSGRARR